jgi:alanine racemase
MNPDKDYSNRIEVLVAGRLCPQVGRITMDQSMIDVTALRGRVAVGDEVVTAISQRVPRVVVAGSGGRGEDG